MRTLLSTLMIITILVCGCIYFPGCTVKNPPVIASFSATPASIEAGGSSTLSWTVNGAKSVSLDNGIGNVAVKGTRAITPSVTTVYTLTATNAAGDTTASTQVVVPGTGTTSSTSSSTTGLPTINSFSASPNSVSSGATVTLNWSVSNATSVNIQPGIGNVAASGSTAVMPGISMQFTLTATNSNGSNQASTQVIVSSGTTGTPGTTGTSGTSDTSTGPTTPDTGTHLYGIPYASTQYDFIANAPSAGWGNYGVDSFQFASLTYPGRQGDSEGYVIVLNNATSEDNKAYTKVLETHPQFKTGGQIWGRYRGIPTIQSTDHFSAKVGFLKGASAGNVNFQVWIYPEGSSSMIGITDYPKRYDGTLKTIDIPLSAYAGKKAEFILRVKANNTNAKQGWAVWIDPKIVR